ncbi:MAG TPA: hypothetical protein VFV92_02910, partial [Candidatus Bathyarchaeia archaeon]|nr:hypothetical protein [Candidatus Bathyarchaeia archaeon]
MERASYSWQEVCVSALRESDPKKLIACIEQAIIAIERRHAEWGSNPGTPDELRAIRKAISGLENLANEKLGTHGAVDIPMGLFGTQREFFNIQKRLHLVDPTRRGWSAYLVKSGVGVEKVTVISRPRSSRSMLQGRVPAHALLDSILGGLLIVMGQHARSKALFYYFRLEDQVSATHLLRLI